MTTLDEIKTRVGALPAADLPIVLLPVQVQTRFVTRDGEQQLLVRIYPDDLHLDSHEEALSAAEAEWGRAYWKLIWPAPRNEALRTRAWERLSGRFGAARASWIARRLTPTNLRKRPGAPPVFPRLGRARSETVTPPVLARLLPDRWVVMGYRGGERVVLEAGARIPAELPVSPTFDETPAPRVRDDELPLDKGMRWMADFKEAERIGMGVRIPISVKLAPGNLDTLVVFGVRRSLPAGAAAGLEALLDGHHYTRGLAFVPPGTPTNNTAEASAGFSRRDPGAPQSFQVEIGSPTPGPRSDAGLAARALGLRREVFAAVDGAARTEDLDARHMQTALWPATGGYYLEQLLAGPADRPPAFSQEQLDAARRHFLDFVRSLGPLPSLRIGRQPYGILPVTSLDLHTTSASGEAKFVEALRALRGSWRTALGRVPRLATEGEAGEALVEILRMQPGSVGYRARLAFDRQFFVPAGVVEGELDFDLRAHAALLRRRVEQLAAEGVVEGARFFDVIPGESSTLLDGPLVQPGGEVPGTVLSPDYISFLRTAGFPDILGERLPDGFPPPEELDTLLYLLLRHSVLLAYAGTAYRILARRGALPEDRYREPVLVSIEGGVKPSPTRTLSRVISSDADLRDTIHTLGAAREPEAAALEELRGSLEHLAKLPVDTLARHLGGCLDLFTYRLDAWVTSLATRRLHELRRKRPQGLLVGGFGWVENLAPDAGTEVTTPPAGEDGGPLLAAREPGGAIHAPSLAQASAAAVLRSGYLTRTGQNGARPFAVDLTSERTRTAQWLLDGIRQGQPLSALLGYRFERRLHDLSLDVFIAGFRRISWLAEVYAADDNLREVQQIPLGPATIHLHKAAHARLNSAMNAVRARYELPPTAAVGEFELLASAQVADGLALARLFREGRVPFDRLGTTVSATRQRALEAELAALDATVDALSDALTAEGVYQVVRGNPARAAASVDAVAHGEIQPPDLHVVDTPRPGAAQTHRLVVLLTGAKAAASLEPRQARKAAEPSLDAWLRQMLGDLRNVRCRGEFLGEDGRVLLRRDLTLGVLGLSHTDVLYLSAAAQPDLPSDLERLLEHHLRRSAPATIPPDARVRLAYERTAGFQPAQRSLGEFLEVVRSFRQAVLGARAVDGRDLAQVEGQAPSGVDVTEFRGRADRAEKILVQARGRLARQRAEVEAAATPRTRERALDGLRERLVDLLFLGVSDAVPLSARGADPAAREQLVAQASVVEQEAVRRVDRLAELAAGFDRVAAAPEEKVQHDLERLQTAFGPSFRALPLARPTNADELARAFGGSAAVQGGDPLQALSWLQGVSRVRPGASRLAAALGYASAFERPSAHALKVAQLPFRRGERWIALPAPRGGFPPGKLSLVAHLPTAFQKAKPLAGLVLDEWVEVIPAAEITSGMAFNYDGPGARPPQSLLLACAPPGAATWEVETIEKTLLETLEQARLRAVDPQALNEDFVLQRVLPALYVSLNLAGEAISTDFARVTG